MDSRLIFTRRGQVLRWLGISLAIVALPSHAGISPGDLANMSLEELGNIQITSVSKKAERLADAAASVYVITADDIRRSGAGTIPEVLRLAPNLQVAQVSAAGYAISARGFNGSNSSAPNKLLVLIDGRSVYTPLFSGVFWDAQGVMLEDVERIEVVSGPGGTLWGVNAVNGVINIITRNAGDSQGTLLAGVAGNRISEAAVRHGGVAGTDGHYRVYARYLDREPTATERGSAIDDGGHKSQAGFRFDWSGAASRLSVSGDAYQGAEGQPAPGSISSTAESFVLGDVTFSGADLVARWERQMDNGSSLSIQGYYDHTRRNVRPTFAETLDIVDLQLQHSLRPSGMHSLVWGANLRRSRDRVTNSRYFAFLPANVGQQWTSVFAQDEMALREDLRFTLGARLEKNDYTGTEVLPNARIAWSIAPDHLLWSAVSRAVRAPSRLDHDAFLPGVPPYLLDGGRNVRSEVANVYELGYRGQPSPRFSYSATIFHADYDHLRTQEIDPSYTFLVFDSLMQGRATGVEMWGTWQAAPHWRLSGGYSALDETLRLKPGSNDIAAPTAAGNDPSHSWQLRSGWEIGADRTFDLGLRHVAALAKNEVPAYTALDARFGWELQPGLEFSVTGRNLLGGHAEYGALATRSEIEPGVLVKLTWRR